MNNYFIMHGSFASPFSNWIPWLRKELEQKELSVYTPDLPSGVGYQNYDTWNEIMTCYLNAGLINENTIIYGHSIAPVFICKFLIEHKTKVKRLVLICGFNNYEVDGGDFDKVNSSMFLDNLSDIKSYCDDIICYYSDNDPYVKYDVEKEFADAITDKQYVISGGGHLNAEFGYLEFKELLKHV